MSATCKLMLDMRTQGAALIKEVRDEFGRRYSLGLMSMRFSERPKTQFVKDLKERLVRDLAVEYPKVNVQEVVRLATDYTYSDHQKRPRTQEETKAFRESLAGPGSGSGAAGAGAGAGAGHGAVASDDSDATTMRLALEVSQLEQNLADSRELVQQLSSSDKFVAPEAIAVMVQQTNSLKKQLDAAKEAARSHHAAMLAAAAKSPVKRRRTAGENPTPPSGCSDDTATPRSGVRGKIGALTEYVLVACRGP